MPWAETRAELAVARKAASVLGPAGTRQAFGILAPDLFDTQTIRRAQIGLGVALSLGAVWLVYRLTEKAVR